MRCVSRAGRAISRATAAGASPSQPSEKITTTAPRTIPRHPKRLLNSARRRPMRVPPDQSDAVAPARRRTVSASVCRSAAVSRVSLGSRVAKTNASAAAPAAARGRSLGQARVRGSIEPEMSQSSTGRRRRVVARRRTGRTGSPGFVGAMGSRRTHEERLRGLRETALTDGEPARLCSPIGLHIGLRRPAHRRTYSAGDRSVHRRPDRRPQPRRLRQPPQPHLRPRPRHSPGAGHKLTNSPTRTYGMDYRESPELRGGRR